MGEVFRRELAGFARFLGLGAFDLGGREGAALGDVGGGAAFVPGRGLGGCYCCCGLGVGDVENVEFASGRGLGDGFARWVVRDVVAVDDVVVPVALALLEGCGLEAEGAFPAAGLGCVFVQGELAAVVVPGAEEVDCLAVGRGAEREVELDG